MLTEIVIENLGTLEKSSAEFSAGLTVLTGETGAGKTMVVTGLRLLAGARADSAKIRQGEDKAFVEGYFFLEKNGKDKGFDQALEIIEKSEGVVEEGQVVASRMISSAGRSKALLAGRAVPAAVLGEFAGHVLAVHGQNDQLRLKAPEQQLAALDKSQPGLEGIAQDYSQAFVAWRSLAKDYQRRVESRREMAQEEDRLTHALAEIDAVGIDQDTDGDIASRILNAEKEEELRSALISANVCLDGGEEGEENNAVSFISQAIKHLYAADSDTARQHAHMLEDVHSQLVDVCGELAAQLSSMSVEDGALEKLLQRQQQLKVLMRKYAPDIAGIEEWRADAQQKLESLDTSPAVLEQLREEVKAAEVHMLRKAEVLSAARARAADALGAAVTQELHGLAMASSTFTVNLVSSKYSRTGAEQAEFLLNGRPLSSTASGGELSRIMLALEVVLAESTSGTTMVFDEVDAGVGGSAAMEIGRRLARLAVNNQVIVVTHLPQVAAFAQSHLHVSKATNSSGVTALSDTQRVDELARMLAGLGQTKTAQAHAQELFDFAQSEVAALRAPYS